MSVDTTLVAPVSVGDDAYTGAGSVITEDVPAGALGIARARQQNIEGYTRTSQAAGSPRTATDGDKNPLSPDGETSLVTGQRCVQESAPRPSSSETSRSVSRSALHSTAR